MPNVFAGVGDDAAAVRGGADGLVPVAGVVTALVSPDTPGRAPARGTGDVPVRSLGAETCGDTGGTDCAFPAVSLHGWRRNTITVPIAATAMAVLATRQAFGREAFGSWTWAASRDGGSGTLTTGVGAATPAGATSSEGGTLRIGLIGVAGNARSGAPGSLVTSAARCCLAADSEPCASAVASTTCCNEGHRSSGFFASMRETSASSSGGQSGRRARIGSGASRV